MKRILSGQLSLRATIYNANRCQLEDPKHNSKRRRKTSSLYFAIYAIGILGAMRGNPDYEVVYGIQPLRIKTAEYRAQLWSSFV